MCVLFALGWSVGRNRFGGLRLYGKIRNEQTGSGVRCTANVHIDPTLNARSQVLIHWFRFSQSLLPPTTRLVLLVQ